MSKKEYKTEEMFFNEIDLSKFRKGKNSATSFKWISKDKTSGIRVSLLYSEKKEKYYVKVETITVENNEERDSDVPF